MLPSAAVLASPLAAELRRGPVFFGTATLTMDALALAAAASIELVRCGCWEPLASDAVRLALKKF